MQLEAKKHLQDMLAAAEKILRFTSSKTLSDYRDDELLRSAVERQFVTIGEAMIRLRAVAPELLPGITDSVRIIRFRNIVVHGYDALTHETVWDVVQKNVPLLRNEAQALLRS